MKIDPNSDKARYFDMRWQEYGGRVVALEPGTKIFHGGLARNVDDFNLPRTTWFATGFGARNYAHDYTKLGYKGKRAYLLVCSPRRPLKCAYFKSADFREFIDEHYGGWPPRMVPALYEWGISQKDLDGIYFDCEKTEIALFQASSDLLVKVSCEPAAERK